MRFRVRYYVGGEEQADESWRSLPSAIRWALALWDSTEGLPFAIERGTETIWRAAEYSEDEPKDMAMRRRISFEKLACEHGVLRCVPSAPGV